MTRARLAAVVYAGIVALAVLTLALSFTPTGTGASHVCRGTVTHPAGARGAVTTTTDKCRLVKP